MALRSARVKEVVMPKKNGADSIGLTIGNSPAKVSRNALKMPLTIAWDPRVQLAGAEARRTEYERAGEGLASLAGCLARGRGRALPGGIQAPGGVGAAL